MATLLFIATGHHVVDTWDVRITEYWTVHMQSGKVRAPTLIFEKPAPLAPSSDQMAGATSNTMAAGCLPKVCHRIRASTIGGGAF